MRFWHGMGYTPIEELTLLARHAESLGFYGVTLGDYWITAETQVDTYAIAEDGVTPWEHTVPWPDPWEGAVYPREEIEDYVRRAREARLAETGRFTGFRMIVACTDPTPDRLRQLSEWGVTDDLKPPWTVGLHATETPLEYKLEEMSDFARAYSVGSRE